MTDASIRYHVARPLPNTDIQYDRRKAIVEKATVEGAGSTAVWVDREIMPSGIVWRDVSGSGTGSAAVVAVRPIQQEFNIVISRIFQLLEDEDDLKPTAYALATASGLVYEANRILGGAFARASVAVGEDGSISIYWRNPEKTFELSIPAHKQGHHYIYHHNNAGHGVERQVTGETLAHWLKWFMHV